MNTVSLLWWVLIFVGLVGSALCSGLEVGMYSVNRVRLLVRSRLQRALRSVVLLRHELDQSARALTTLLILNNAFNYLSTLAITALLTMRGLSDVTIIVLQAVILTPVILVFGEAIPKEVFRVHADGLMPRFARVLVGARMAMTAIGVLPVLLRIARMVARVLGVDPMSAVGSGRERMSELLKYGTGQLSDQQVSLIDRALIFEHTTIGDQMLAVHPAEVIGIDWTCSRAAKGIAGSSLRWVPVVGEEKSIIGMVSVLDLHHTGTRSIEELMIEPVRIDASASVRQGLEALKKAGASVAVVVENGHDTGIVTIKDLVSPLLGGS